MYGNDEYRPGIYAKDFDASSDFLDLDSDGETGWTSVACVYGRPSGRPALVPWDMSVIHVLLVPRVRAVRARRAGCDPLQARSAARSGNKSGHMRLGAVAIQCIRLRSTRTFELLGYDRLDYDLDWRRLD